MIFVIWHLVKSRKVSHGISWQINSLNTIIKFCNKKRWSEKVEKVTVVVPVYNRPPKRKMAEYQGNQGFAA